ncbi:52 kDa repressor of the inhibitor of the protein kinase-like [Hydra vulgaris]|uniref:52 kDa repressor of the inhibitor of the protein kinase-like n=1 Tax=Hydra vulgaris TaxID=6087 RepID=A0ABM4CUL6_HYDVU
MPHLTSIHAELDLWETFWNNQSVIPSTITETLKSIDIRGFPNIRKGFLIMGTILITKCECERSISVIRRLKTYMRSRMTGSRFNSLALMSFHQEIIPDVERVLNIFSVLGERLLELVVPNINLLISFLFIDYIRVFYFIFKFILYLVKIRKTNIKI